MSEIKIDITEEVTRFEDHLNLIDNYQTIVSGIFGIGKTYFIKEFFETYKDKYEIVYISPINYTVSQNEDIFEYIKFDVIFELLSKNVDFEKMDFSKLLTFQFFFQDNVFDIVSLIVENSNKIGKNVSGIWSSLKQLKNKFNSYHNAVQIDEEKELVGFLKEIADRKGLIYEENRITRIISSINNELKDSNKKIVLIIDDLDRIDPEHIFRLFNVFACHIDNTGGDINKFDFDKIIFVCDIENIRNIFHSKYGMNVDFTGYIDKFYSREIYHYDNRRLIEKNISKILGTIQTSEQYRHILDFRTNEKGINLELKDILINLINSNALNLRTLLKLANKQYQIKIYTILFEGQYDRISSIHLNIVLMYDFFLSLYGTHLSLDIAIMKCEKNRPLRSVDSIILWRVGFLLTILDYEKHKFKDGHYVYNNNALDLTIHYEIKHFGDWNDLIAGRAERIVKLNEQETDLTIIPFFTLLRMTFDKLNQYKKI